MPTKKIYKKPKKEDSAGVRIPDAVPAHNQNPTNSKGYRYANPSNSHTYGSAGAKVRGEYNPEQRIQNSYGLDRRREHEMDARRVRDQFVLMDLYTRANRAQRQAEEEARNRQAQSRSYNDTMNLLDYYSQRPSYSYATPGGTVSVPLSSEKPMQGDQLAEALRAKQAQDYMQSEIDRRYRQQRAGADLRAEREAKKNGVILNPEDEVAPSYNALTDDRFMRNLSNRADYERNSQYKAGSTFTGDLINNVGDTRQLMENATTMAQGMNQSGSSVLPYPYVQDYMDENEKNTYNYLLNTYGQDKAEEYFKQIEPELNRKWSEAYNQNVENFSTQNPVMGAIASALSVPGKGIYDTAQMIQMLAGAGMSKATGEPLDINNPYMTMTNTFGTMRNAVNEQVTEEGGEWAGWAYGTAMSIADNLYQLGMAGGFGANTEAAKKQSENLVLGLMGTGAAAASIRENIESGMDQDRAVILGIGSGLIEVLTEKIGMDNLFNTAWTEGKSSFVKMIKMLAKQAASEGAEEGLSDIMNWSADYLYDVITAKNEASWYRDFADQKAQHPELTDNEIWGLVYNNMAKELGMDILGGAVSGFAMGGGMTLLGTANAKTDINKASTKVTEEDTAKIIADAMNSTDENVAKAAEQLNEKKQNGQNIDLEEARDLFKKSAMADYYSEIFTPGKIEEKISTEDKTAAVRLNLNEQELNDYRTIRDAAPVVKENVGPFEMDFMRVYRAGQNGINLNDVKTEPNSVLSDELKKTAYNLGRMYIMKNSAGQFLNMDKIRADEVHETFKSYKNAGFVNTPAAAEIFKNAEAAKTYDGICKALGVVGTFANTIVDEKGRVIANGMHSDGVIVIAKDSNFGEYSTYLKDKKIKWTPELAYRLTFGHEIAHRLAVASPKTFAKLRDAIIAYRGENRIRAEVKYQMDLNSKHPGGFTEAMAMEEVVADFIAFEAYNQELFEKFLQEHSQTEEGRGILGKLRDGFKSVVDKIRGVKGAETEVEKMQNIVNLINKALKETAEKAAASEKTALPQRELQRRVDRAEGLYSAKEIKKLDVNKDLAEVMEKGGYRMPDNGAYSIRTEVLWDEALKTLAKGYENTAEYANAVQLVHSMTNQVLNDVEMLDFVPTGLVKGDPLRENVEYLVTFDMDALCPRTYEFGAYRDAVERSIGRKMNEKETRALIENLRAYGMMIPCTYCYVENKRMALSRDYLNYVSYRQAIVNAKTDAEAYKVLPKSVYDTSKKQWKKGSEGWQKRFKSWRAEGRGAYAPSAEELYDAVMSSEAAVFNWLDEQYGDESNYKGKFKDYTLPISQKDARKNVCEHFGIEWKESRSSAAQKEIDGIFETWLYDMKMRVPHNVNPKFNDATEINIQALEFNRGAMNYAHSSSQAHDVDNYAPYSDQLLKMTVPDKAYINARGGIRKHSSNDFRLDNLVDYIQFYTHLALDKRGGFGWFGHTYTKDTLFARLFAPTNDRINISIAMFGDNGRLGAIRPNLDEGADWNETRELRNKYENVGAMAMITNDAQLSYALNSDWIDMIIPFHASGMPRELYNDVMAWKDYTSVQSDQMYTDKQLKEMGVDPDSIIRVFEYRKGKNWATSNKPQNIHFLPGPQYIGAKGEAYLEHMNDKNYKGDLKAEYDALVKSGNIIPGHENNADRYLELCKEYGVKPRFSGIEVTDANGNTIDITEHPNYVKVLKETARTDTQQKEITMEGFDLNKAIEQLKARSAHGGYNTVKGNEAIVNDFVENVINKKKPVGYVTAKALATKFASNPSALSEIIDENGEYLTEGMTVDELREFELTHPMEEKSLGSASVRLSAKDDGAYARLAKAIETNANWRSDAKLRKEVDAEYLRLAEDPAKNETALRRMLDAAAKAWGADRHLYYHGTEDFGFTVPDTYHSDDNLSFFTTRNQELASTYAGRDYVREISEQTDGIPDYMSIPFDDLVKAYAEAFEKAPTYYTEGKKLFDWLKEKDIEAGVDEKEAGWEEYNSYARGLIWNQTLDYIDMIKADPDATYGGARRFMFTEENMKKLMKFAKLKTAPSSKQIRELYEILCSNKSPASGDAQLRKNVMTYVYGISREGIHQMSDPENPIYYGYADFYGNLTTAWLMRSKLDLDKKHRWSSGIYQFYGNPGNAYVYEGEGENWDELIDPEGGDDYIRTRDLAGWAAEKGYDSVILEYITDDGGRNEFASNTTGDVVIFFEPQDQLKSADLVTRDDDGEIIPLSERFNPDNPDIRFSAKDSEGRMLSPGQRDFYKDSKIRDENGDLLVGYHTTENGGFTIFDPKYSDDKTSLFFATNFNVSQTYGRYADRPISFRNNYNSWNEFEKDFVDRTGESGSLVNLLNITVRDKSKGGYATALGKTATSRFDKWMQMQQNGEDVSSYEIEMDDPGYLAKGDSFPDKESIRVTDIESLLKKLSDAMNLGGKGQHGYYKCYFNITNPLVVDANGGYWNSIPYAPGIEDIIRPRTVAERIKDLEKTMKTVVSDVRITYDFDDMYNEVHLEIIKRSKTKDGTWKEDNYVNTFTYDADEYIDEDGDTDLESFESDSWYDVIDVLQEQIGPGCERFYDMLQGEQYESYDLDIFYHSKSPTGGEWFDDKGEWNFAASEEEDPEVAEKLKGIPKYNTRALAKYAKEHGHDGVLIKNLYDPGGNSDFNKPAEMSDIIIAFNSNQVKDVNNLNPTKNPDIRYSVKESAEYRAASAAFREIVDEWNEDGRPDGEELILGTTGPIIQGLGAIENDIYLDTTKINKILLDHPEMDIATIKKIPQILEHPVLILKSKHTGRGGTNSRLIIFGNVKANNGKNVMSILDLRPIENKLVVDDMQKVSSAYTKDTSPASFLESSEVVYVDIKRSHQLIHALGFLSPSSLPLDGFIGRIYYSKNKVNIEGVNFLDIFYNPQTGEGNPSSKFSLKSDVDSYELDYRLAALEKENERLAKQIANYRIQNRRSDADHVARAQGKIPVMDTITEKAAKDLAKDIVKSYNAAVPTGDLAKQIQKASLLMVREAARPAAMRGTNQAAVDDALWKVACDMAEKVLDNSRDIPDAELTGYREQFDHYETVNLLAGDILERMMKAEKVKPTKADKNAMKLQETRRAANKRLQDAIKRERANKEKAIADLKAHNKEVQQNKRARHEASVERTRLLRVADRLKKLKTTNANRALIEQTIRDVIGGDLATVYKTMTGERLEKLQALKAWYEGKTTEGSPTYDPDFVRDARIEAEIRELEQLHVNDLNLEQVTMLNDILRYLENEIRTNKKTINTSDQRLAADQGFQIIKDTRAAEGINHLEKLQKSIITEVLRPETLVKRIVGYDYNSPLWQRYQDLEDGQLEMVRYQMQANRMFDKFIADKKFWKMMTGKHAEELTLRGIDTETNEPVELKITPAMRMSIYLHSLNEDNMRHMSKGGLTVPEIGAYKKGNLQKAYDKATTVRISQSYARSLYDQMSAAEKAYLETVQRYFNEVSTPAINEVSNLLKGYDIAEVENYFPINTDQAFSRTAFGEMKHDGSIEGMGSLKERVKNAMNPILLIEVEDVVNRAVKDNSKYVGLAIPIRNFNKVMGINQGSFDSEGNWKGVATSVQREIAKKWNSFTMDYLNNLFDDLQNPKGLRDNNGAWFQKLQSKYAGGVLELNAGVAIKQAASLPTAAAVLGYGPILRAMANVGRLDEANYYKYSPLGEYRERGYASQELGDIKEQGIKLPKGLNWIQAMDSMTVRKLFKASEYYVRENYPNLTVGSEAYWKKVGEVHTDVITQTQPNYTTLQRPQILRSQNTLVKALNMFKTQPFQNFNILFEAAGEFRATGNRLKMADTAENRAAHKAAGRKLARAISSQLLSSLVFALMQAAWDLFRKKDKKYRDEDEELTFGSFLGGIGLNMLTNAGGMLPWMNTILEWGMSLTDALTKELNGEQIFGGQRFYGMEVGVLSNLTDTADALKNAVVKTVKYFNENKNVTGYDAVGEMIDATADVLTTLGLPAENFRNDIYAAYNWIYQGITGEETNVDSSTIFDTEGRTKENEIKKTSKRFKDDPTYQKYRELADQVPGYSNYDVDEKVKELYKGKNKTYNDKYSEFMSEDEYILYELSVRIADLQNDANGGYKQEEYRKAMDTLSFLTKAEKSKIWTDALKFKTNNPYN